MTRHCGSPNPGSGFPQYSQPMNCLRFLLETRREYRLSLGQSSHFTAVELSSANELKETGACGKWYVPPPLQDEAPSCQLSAFSRDAEELRQALMLVVSEIGQREREPSCPIHRKARLEISILVCGGNLCSIGTSEIVGHVHLGSGHRCS